MLQADVENNNGSKGCPDGEEGAQGSQGSGVRLLTKAR